MAERQTASKSSSAAVVAVAPEPTDAPESTYARLAAEFDQTFSDVRGGVELTYVTGEQVTSRLNEVLGVAGWSFRVLQHEVHIEADEAWVLGELVAEVDGKTVTRQQFGSQKIKRSRSTGTPLDIGFDLKGAGTDAMKKCASLLGVGLYLSRKDAPEQRANGGGASHEARTSAPAGFGQAAFASAGGSERCEECGAELKETRFKDGTAWAPSQLAGYGRRKHGKVLCMDHYRAANEARKAAVLEQLSA